VAGRYYIGRPARCAFSTTPYGEATATGNKARGSVLHEKKGIDMPAIRERRRNHVQQEMLSAVPQKLHNAGDDSGKSYAINGPMNPPAISAEARDGTRRVGTRNGFTSPLGSLRHLGKK
jgi:hypothetical protein